MAVKIGNSDITLKLGSSDVTAAYIGDTLVYSGGTQPQTLQWVTFSNGDTIPSDLQIYGIRGKAANIADTFFSYDEDIIAELNRNKVDFYFGERSGSTCYSEQVLATKNVEYIFGNISCSDYFNMSTSVSVFFTTFQLYIYA